MKKKSRQNFTVVELLVVIGVIAVLSGISVGVSRYVSQRNREMKTQAILKQVELGLEAVKNRFGFYPPSEGAAFELPEKDGSAWTITGNLPTNYIKLFAKSVDMELLWKSSKNGKLVDGWDRPVYYASPGTHNKSSFDLVSAGADGKAGSAAADFWKADGSVNGSVADFNPEESDDLANF